MDVVNSANNHKIPDNAVELNHIANFYFSNKRVGDESMNKKKDSAKKTKKRWQNLKIV